jgi:hypothetical protein|tara:strand:- start:84 stop:452 length:369 start_codon:yes stop_codon:yes gene_type:complete
MDDTVKAWEYPEDDWISMGDNFDMNMWTDDIDGKMRISIYAVRNGQTDAVFPLSSYEVIKTKEDLTDSQIDANDEIDALVIRLRRVAELICIDAGMKSRPNVLGRANEMKALIKSLEERLNK